MCEFLNPSVRLQRCPKAAPSTAVLRFALGRLTATPNALALLDAYGVHTSTLLVRHQAGDWGDVGPDIAAENERSLKNGGQILSAYRLLASSQLEPMTALERRRSPTVWILSEAGFGMSTLLTQRDY
jgi:hypothetical protein